MAGRELVTGSFLAIVAFVVWAGVRAWTRSASDPGGATASRALLGAAAWLALSALPTLTGLLRPGGPLPPQAVMGAILALALAVGLSRRGGAMAASMPLVALVAFQGFRLPLEIVLHLWGEQGVVPEQMTWSGQNFDVISGILALAFIPWVRHRPAAAWIPTVIGGILLLNVVRIVATSLPGPMLQFSEPLELAYRFPHVWIATVCVPGAVLGHVLAVRALLGLRRRSAAPAA